MLCLVSLHAREWIEIKRMQHPVHNLYVSLHAREWIEIFRTLSCPAVTTVSLHAREWIEIASATHLDPSKLSLSMRESGLKYGLSDRKTS